MDPSKNINEEEKTSLMIGSGEVDVSDDSTGKDALAAGDVPQPGSGLPASSCPTAGVIRYNSTPSGTLPSGDCMQAYKVNNYSGHWKIQHICATRCFPIASLTNM